MINIVHNADCLPAMREMKDNQFDLAIVDPPFREDNQPTQTMRESGDIHRIGKPPKDEFFNELFRISNNQIIMGGNYFRLPLNNNWIIWYKNNDGVGFSMAEMFWSSIVKNVKVYALRPMGENGVKIHPTQKPIKLYKWLLKNYAKEGDTILDTHVGSGSSRIACWEMGFDFTGYEIDKDYWNAQEKRFNIVKNQINLFKKGE